MGERDRLTGEMRRMVRGRVVTALTTAVAAVVTAAAGNAQANAGEQGAITVQGESATRTNLATVADRRASGGRYLALATARKPPAAGWYATYTVHVSAAGIYQMEAVATAPTEGAEEDAANGSYVNLSVNGSPFRQVARSQAHWEQSPHAWGDLHRLRLDAIELRRGTNSITFMVDEPALVSESVLHRLLLDEFTLSPTALALRGVHLQDPATNLGVYRAGEAAILHLDLNGRSPTARTVAYEIRDYFATKVASGIVTIPAGAASAKTSLPALRPGNFMVRAALSSSPDKAVTGHFAQLPGRPAVSGPANRFGVNTWAPTLIPSSRLTPLARALRQMGAGYVRDDAAWSAAEPARGHYRTTPQDGVVRAFHRQGLRVLQVFTGPPSWAMNPNSVPLPVDLRVAHGFARYLSGKPTDARPDAVQMSNEPDVDDTASTGDQQAAYVKAAALGVAARPDRPRIVLPGIAGNVAYQGLMLQSDVVRYADAWAFHAYPWPPSDKEPAVPSAGEQRRLWRRYGVSQIWQTEFGHFLKAPGYDLDWRRQVVQARYLVRATVQGLADGVDKPFWFAGPPLGSEGHYFGLFSRDYQPLPSYSAHAAMASILGRANHITRLRGMPAKVTGHVFDTGANSVTVLWADKPTQARVPVSGGKVAVYNIMGMRRPLRSAGGTVTLMATRDPIYVVSGRIKGVHPNASRRSWKPSPAERIVLSQRYAPANAAPNKDSGQAEPPFGYRLDTATRMYVDVYNFSPIPRTVAVSGRANGGWSVHPARATTVTVPAMGRAAIPFTLRAGPKVRSGSDQRLVFTATLSRRPIPPSVSWIQLKS